jgi:hypothetical protein
VVNTSRLPDESDEEALPPFGELVAGLGDVYEDVGDEADMDAADQEARAMASARADILTVDRVTIALSVEVQVGTTPSDDVRVLGSTPTQWTETTVMPVFHRLTMHIEQALGPDGHGEE